MRGAQEELRRAPRRRRRRRWPRPAWKSRTTELGQSRKCRGGAKTSWLTTPATSHRPSRSQTLSFVDPCHGQSRCDGKWGLSQNADCRLTVEGLSRRYRVPEPDCPITLVRHVGVLSRLARQHRNGERGGSALYSQHDLVTRVVLRVRCKGQRWRRIGLYHRAICIARDDRVCKSGICQKRRTRDSGRVEKRRGSQPSTMPPEFPAESVMPRDRRVPCRDSAV